MLNSNPQPPNPKHIPHSNQLYGRKFNFIDPYSLAVQKKGTILYTRKLYCQQVFHLQNNLCQFTTVLTNSNGYFVSKKRGQNTNSKNFCYKYVQVRLRFYRVNSISTHLLQQLNSFT